MIKLYQIEPVSLFEKGQAKNPITDYKVPKICKTLLIYGVVMSLSNPAGMGLRTSAQYGSNGPFQ